MPHLPRHRTYRAAPMIGEHILHVAPAPTSDAMAGQYWRRARIPCPACPGISSRSTELAALPGQARYGMQVRRSRGPAAAPAHTAAVGEAPRSRGGWREGTSRTCCRARLSCSICTAPTWRRSSRPSGWGGRRRGPPLPWCGSVLDTPRLQARGLVLVEPTTREDPMCTRRDIRERWRMCVSYRIGDGDGLCGMLAGPIPTAWRSHGRPRHRRPRRRFHGLLRYRRCHLSGDPCARHRPSMTERCNRRGGR